MVAESTLRGKVPSVLADPFQPSARDAALTLEEIAHLQRRTRTSLGTPWFPLVCFGAVNLLSAAVIAADGTGALAPLWIVAGGAAMLVTRRHYRRRAERRGVTGRGRRIWLISAAMFTGCLGAGVVAGMLGGEVTGLLAPITLVLAGYVVLGWLQRSALAPLAVLPGVAVAIVLATRGQPPWLIELAFGAALTVAGVVVRAVAERA